MTNRNLLLLPIMAVYVFLFGPITAYGQTPTTQVWVHHFSAGSMTASKILPSRVDQGAYLIYHPLDGLQTNFACSRLAADETILWTHFFTDAMYPGNTLADALVDGQGNLILVFNSLFDVEAGDLSHRGVLVHLMKLNRDGELLWEQEYRRAADYYAQASSSYLDNENRIFITGTTAEAEYAWTANDAFLISLNSSGDVLWERYLGLRNGVHLSENQGVLQLVRWAAPGAYLVQGIDKLTGDDASEASLFANVMDSDLYLRSTFTDYYFLGNNRYHIKKHNNAGELVWEYALEDGGATTVEQVFQIDIDASGNVYAQGAQAGDVLVTKLDPNGNFLWETTYEGEFTCAFCPTREHQPIRTLGNSVWIMGMVPDGMRLIELAADNGELLQEITYELANSSGFHFPRSLLKIEDYLYFTGMTRQGNGVFYTVVKYALMLSNTTEQSRFDQLQVYPNPTNDHLEITGGQGLVEISIYDELGRQLRGWSHGGLTGATMKIDLSQLPSGVYSLHFQFEGKGSTVRRIVKN